MSARLEPAPGYTVPGVEIPGVPSEQEATQAAVDYGWLIAVVIVGAVIVAIVRSVTKQINFRLVGIILLVAGGAYLYGKAQGS